MRAMTAPARDEGGGIVKEHVFVSAGRVFHHAKPVADRKYLFDLDEEQREVFLDYEGGSYGAKVIVPIGELPVFGPGARFRLVPMGGDVERAEDV
jgi:hypothetical protein